MWPRLVAQLRIFRLGQAAQAARAERSCRKNLLRKESFAVPYFDSLCKAEGCHRFMMCNFLNYGSNRNLVHSHAGRCSRVETSTMMIIIYIILLHCIDVLYLIISYSIMFWKLKSWYDITLYMTRYIYIFDVFDIIFFAIVSYCITVYYLLFLNMISPYDRYIYIYINITWYIILDNILNRTTLHYTILCYIIILWLFMYIVLCYITIYCIILDLIVLYFHFITICNRFWSSRFQRLPFEQKISGRNGLCIPSLEVANGTDVCVLFTSTAQAVWISWNVLSCVKIPKVIEGP